MNANDRHAHRLPDLETGSSQTQIVAHRYDRVARIYRGLEGLDRRWTRRWRAELWSEVEGRRVLEVGVGTGINFPFHPPGAEVVALDVSPKMLAVARGHQSAARVHLTLGDVQDLQWESSSFDTVVATFVFCSVPDPLRGLEEVRRVLRPGGRLLLLEHVISSRRWLAMLMRLIDPIVSRMSGAHIARDTVENVRRAGFVDVVARPLVLDVVQHIEARAPLG